MGRLIGKMKSIQFKSIQILSNGSLNFHYKNSLTSESFKFFEKDNKNFYLNKKEVENEKIKLNYSLKNKYFTSN